MMVETADTRQRMQAFIDAAAVFARAYLRYNGLRVANAPLADRRRAAKNMLGAELALHAAAERYHATKDGNR